MFKVTAKLIVADHTKRISVEAPLVAQKAQPGQFVMVMASEGSARIPLSIVDADAKKGIITLIFKEVDETTRKLGAVRIGDELSVVLGPLGVPIELVSSSVCVCIGYDIGIAQILPIARALKGRDNKVISVIGAATRKSLFFESQLRLSGQRLFVTTDDGSHMLRGSVTSPLSEIFAREKVSIVYAMGPVDVLGAVCEITQEKKIKTIIGLQPVMADGLGLCASCRVKVHNEYRLACVDGPNVNGHQVDFDDLRARTCAQKECRSCDSKKPLVSKDKRIKNFNEVSVGLNKKQALDEANRCPQCTHPACQGGCSLGIDITGFIRKIRENQMASTLDLIREKNPLPGVCGRLCQAPCQKVCILSDLQHKAISVRALERYAIDHGHKKSKSVTKRKGKKIAVVGSGPAGLTAAGELAKRGYAVTVFEAFDLAGGVLRYGIPEFRFPKKILDSEIDYVQSLGVEIRTNTLIGQTLTLQDLFQDGFAAVLLALGAGAAKFSGLPGEHSGGVYFAQEYLLGASNMKTKLSGNQQPIYSGRDVVVIGGEYAAMDCARLAARLGKNVRLVHKGTEEDMVVDADSIRRAKEEGVELDALTKPLEIVTDQRNCVRAVQCIKMDYADPDRTDKWRLIPVKGSEFTIEADTVVLAIGHQPNPLIRRLFSDLRINKDRTLWTVRNSAQSSQSKIFATGDVVNGPTHVMNVISQAKKAACEIDEYLNIPIKKK
ncbi:MAG: sulfide/dihydroorotate dehydrogenase-like FAD/NAD-binding protein [Candidatus Omnitrophota bacterium]